MPAGRIEQVTESVEAPEVRERCRRLDINHVHPDTVVGPIVRELDPRLTEGLPTDQLIDNEGLHERPHRRRHRIHQGSLVDPQHVGRDSAVSDIRLGVVGDPGEQVPRPGGQPDCHDTVSSSGR